MRHFSIGASFINPCKGKKEKKMKNLKLLLALLFLGWQGVSRGACAQQGVRNFKFFGKICVHAKWMICYTVVFYQQHFYKQRQQRWNKNHINPTWIDLGTFTFSKSTIETLKKDVKYMQN